MRLVKIILEEREFTRKGNKGKEMNTKIEKIIVC